MTDTTLPAVPRPPLWPQIITAVMSVVLVAIAVVGWLTLRQDIADLQDTATANSELLASIDASLDSIEANTAPPVYFESYCTDPEALEDRYESMVYDSTDNINQQAHRQREFRLEVLTHCNR